MAARRTRDGEALEVVRQVAWAADMKIRHATGGVLAGARGATDAQAREAGPADYRHRRGPAAEGGGVRGAAARGILETCSRRGGKRAMTGTLIALALAIVGITLAPPVRVLAQGGSPSVWGLGTARCERYLEAAQRSDQARRYVDWLQGFLTAAEWLTSSRVGDPQSAIVWLNEYCRQNAQAPLSTAAMALTSHLAERAKTGTGKGGAR